MARALQGNGERVTLQWKRIALGSVTKEEKLLTTESRYQGAASDRRDQERPGETMRDSAQKDNEEERVLPL
jgi:hypothetical protein